MKLITSSWDDGNILDFKIANLLEKYNLQGTFYIPKENYEHSVMQQPAILELSKKFEIGGHTLNHVFLKGKPDDILEYEVNGSFIWLKDILQAEPVSFCFPGGKFDKKVISLVAKSGYKIYRTTELLSIQPLNKNLLSTTIQVFEHSRFTYIKHLIKRRKINNLLLWLQSHSTINLLKLTDFYLNRIRNKGIGCFHLWGHSWEIEQFGLWDKLEELFRHLCEQSDFIHIQNRELLTLPNFN